VFWFEDYHCLFGVVKVQQWVGSINEVMNVKSSMDGDNMEPLLLNKWLI